MALCSLLSISSVRHPPDLPLLIAAHRCAVFCMPSLFAVHITSNCLLFLPWFFLSLFSLEWSGGRISPGMMESHDKLICSSQPQKRSALSTSLQFMWVWDGWRFSSLNSFSGWLKLQAYFKYQIFPMIQEETLSQKFYFFFKVFHLPFTWVIFHINYCCDWSIQSGISNLMQLRPITAIEFTWYCLVLRQYVSITLLRVKKQHFQDLPQEVRW